MERERGGGERGTGFGLSRAWGWSWAEVGRGGRGLASRDPCCWGSASLCWPALVLRVCLATSPGVSYLALYLALPQTPRQSSPSVTKEAKHLPP